MSGQVKGRYHLGSVLEPGVWKSGARMSTRLVIQLRVTIGFGPWRSVADDGLRVVTLPEFHSMYLRSQ